MTFTISQICIIATIALVQIGEGKLRTEQVFAGHSPRIRLVPPPPRDANTTMVKTDYFLQKLDHFDSSATATWNQRYQISNYVYKEGGPIFVMIGAEQPLSARSLVSGQMYQNAKTHGALLLELEHRFYGESHPTSDVSIANLRYLHSTHALADLDAFIRGMKEQYKIPNAKVVVFGGSYAGSLVVWYRLLYPNSSVGGVASSAPVLYLEDFTEYIETVGDAMKYFVPGCYKAVSDAFKAIQDLVAAKDDDKLNSLFGICDTGKLNYSDSYDIQTFYSSLFDNWAYTTQYNGVGNTSLLATMCQTMIDASHGQPVERFAKIFHNVSGECANHDYQGEITMLKEDSWDSEIVINQSRQWAWQTCNEFGNFQTTDSNRQPFGYETVALKYLEDIECTQPFGITSEEIIANVAQTNKRYGGKAPNVTNTFFFNGSIDPWHKLSIYEYDHDLNKSCPSRFIEGISHCYDMNEDRPDDPPSLTKARQEMAAAISAWLAA